VRVRAALAVKRVGGFVDDEGLAPLLVSSLALARVGATEHETGALVKDAQSALEKMGAKAMGPLTKGLTEEFAAKGGRAPYPDRAAGRRAVLEVMGRIGPAAEKGPELEKLLRDLQYYDEDGYVKAAAEVARGRLRAAP